jgi:choline kinase
VLCARAHVNDEFLLTMADHILDDRIMEMIQNHKPPEGGATLCVDYKVNTIFDIDDATKVFEQGGWIKKIGKEIKDYNCIDTGVFIGTAGLFDAINQIYQTNGDASLTDGVQVLASAGKMEALDIKQAYWQDVDTPEMLEYAEALLHRQMKN